MAAISERMTAVTTGRIVTLRGYPEKDFGHVLSGNSTSLGEWQALKGGGFIFLPDGKNKPSVMAKSLHGFYEGLEDWFRDFQRNSSRT